MEIYDLHNHLLPSIDDGPDDMEETLEIVKISSNQGVKFILATPHKKDVNELHSINHIRDLADKTNELASARGYEAKIKLGMENHLDTALVGDIQNGCALTMNEGKYILVEMPWEDIEIDVVSILTDIQDIGLTPVIAHPERMKMFINNYEFLHELVDQGALMQLTASSLYGKFGKEIEVFSHEILSDGLCHIIASDTHMARGQREPDLIKGFEFASKIVGPEDAFKLVSDNPRELLNINDI